MSNTSDDNSTNESLASSSNSSRSNPIKASMLRPSALLSGTAASSSTSPTEGGGATTPKNFLRPASFQVDSSTDANNSTSTTTGASPAKDTAGVVSASGAGDSSPTTDTAAAAAVASVSNSNTAASTASPSSTSSSAGGTPAASSGTVANPFLRSSDDADAEEHCEAASSGSTVAANGNDAAVTRTNGLSKTANLFKTANPTIPTTTTGPTDFVFGQNVHERVTIESINNDCTSSSSTSSASSSQLFAIAASTSAAAAADKAAATTPGTEATVESLSEVARQYEESRAQKRKYEEVETFTGEEDETNVMDVNCKLFAFVASNWEERGPGNLRVNDNKDRSKSPRVVFRTSGNLRVLLNTTIWPGMVVERPSQKSLRFSAIDADGQIKIFLAMARPDDISILVSQLNKRISYEKSRPTPSPVVAAAAAAVTAAKSSVDVTADASSSNDAATGYLDPAVVDMKTDGERDAVDSSSEPAAAEVSCTSSSDADKDN